MLPILTTSTDWSEEACWLAILASMKGRLTVEGGVVVGVRTTMCYRVATISNSCTSMNLLK